MTNQMYDKALDAFAKGLIDWEGDTFKVAACSATYVRNIATHEFRSSLSGVVATSPALTGTVVANGGVCDADSPLTYTAPTGDVVTQLVVYQDTGNAATDRLVCNIDTATGLPFDPDGVDVDVSWSDGANKVFRV